MKKTNFRLKYFLVPLGTAFIVPSLIIFLLEVLVGRIPPLKSIQDIIHRQFARGDNLFLLALFGSIPFLIHIAVLFSSSFSMDSRRLDYLLWGGLTGTLIVMFWGHISIWGPLYSQGHMSSTAVIGFLFIPFLCIPTMLIGTGVGWFLSKRPGK